MRSTATAGVAALVILCSNLCDLVSAQNAAGKLAARTKLADTSASRKKRKPFWWSKKKNVDKEEDKDGECSWTQKGIRKCWWWDLFLADSELIIKSVVMSFLCSAVSWLWFLRSQNDDKQIKEENKGGKSEPLFLFSVHDSFSHFILSPFSPLQLKTLFVIIPNNCIRASFNPLKLALKIFPCI
jgi:hypothetical protein